MKTLTVAFFGHRQMTDPFRVEENLMKLIKKLLEEHEFVEFLVGREGDFDLLAAAVVRRVNNNLDYGNCALTLILPYIRADYLNNIKNYEVYYDDIDICDEAANAHFKAAIPIRNRNMADRADLIVCCIEHESGGAWTAVKYAQKRGKTICNLFTET